MEKFAVDLDDLLDQLEQEVDASNTSTSSANNLFSNIAIFERPQVKADDVKEEEEEEVQKEPKEEARQESPQKEGSSSSLSPKTPSLVDIEPSLVDVQPSLVDVEPSLVDIEPSQVQEEPKICFDLLESSSIPKAPEVLEPEVSYPSKTENPMEFFVLQDNSSNREVEDVLEPEVAYPSNTEEPIEYLLLYDESSQPEVEEAPESSSPSSTEEPPSSQQQQQMSSSSLITNKNDKEDGESEGHFLVEECANNTTNNNDSTNCDNALMITDKAIIEEQVKVISEQESVEDDKEEEAKEEARDDEEVQAKQESSSASQPILQSSIVDNESIAKEELLRNLQASLQQQHETRKLSELDLFNKSFPSTNHPREEQNDEVLDPELAELDALEEELARESVLEALQLQNRIAQALTQNSEIVLQVAPQVASQATPREGLQEVLQEAHQEAEPEVLNAISTSIDSLSPSGEKSFVPQENSSKPSESTPEPEEPEPQVSDDNAITASVASLNPSGEQSFDPQENAAKPSESTPEPEVPEPEASSSSSNQVEVQPSSSKTDTAEDRGGLVQNVRIFERQEMPNGLMEHELILGKIKPFWVPDEEAQNCLHCDVKFTLIKRRHHCRSCGKVLCSNCCNYRAKLMYLESKEARVCRLCMEILMKIQAIERRNGRPLEIQRENSNPEVASPTPPVAFPDPNNPSEYCSTVSPFDQVPSAPTPPTVMVPVGVLKRRNNEPATGSAATGSSESNPPVTKQVIFSDGVRPGGDLIEDGASSSRLPEGKSGRPQLHLKIPSKPSMEGLILKRKGKPHKVVINDRNGQAMPPIVNYHELQAIDPNLEFLENYEQLVEFLKADWLPSITFNLAKNLFLNAKLVLKDCCKRRWCWSFASRGLASVGQDEVLFVLDCDSYKPETPTSGAADDKETASSTKQAIVYEDSFNFPRDVFKLFLKIYDSASNACPFGEMSHLFFPDGLFGKKENAGFVFVLPTMQCFRNLLLPSPPALIALIIHKWEIPWVRIFPLRLVLRLGHEYNSYPTPVISDANRKSVYYEIGHTIMNVLADFRNFSYTLFTVKDLLIHTEQRKRVKMIIPKASYEQVCKVLSTSNDHVLAFGANFSGKADSHFVCMQHELDLQGEYQTAVATLPEVDEPGITAASFIVFSGALKSTTGVKAKMSVVEDGLLVQIPAQTMEEMRAAIREMKEFKILCCKIGETISDEWVEIAWVNDELSTNLGVRSQIDGTNLEGVQSARIFSSPDFTNERFLIRWIEIFILQINENTRRSEMVNTSRLAESVAQAFCVSMVEFLDQLFEAGFTKIGLRISLDVDRVGYESGSNGTPLPEVFTANLDGALIPAIMDNVSTTGIESAHVIELVFHILYK